MRHATRIASTDLLPFVVFTLLVLRSEGRTDEEKCGSSLVPGAKEKNTVTEVDNLLTCFMYSQILFFSKFSE